MPRASRPLAYPPRPVVAGRKAMVMRRVAAGQDVATAAKAAKLSADEVQAMLGDSRVAQVLATYRDLLVLPDRLQLHMLRRLCLDVILEAVEEREPRVCVWFFHETERGREPHGVLAQSIVRMLKRTPPAEPESRAPPPIDPAAYDPFSEGYPNRARLRVLSRLRLRVIEELAAHRAVLLEGIGHDPASPVPAAFDWLRALGIPPLPAAAARAPVPEPRAGP